MNCSTKINPGRGSLLKTGLFLVLLVIAAASAGRAESLKEKAYLDHLNRQQQTIYEAYGPKGVLVYDMIDGVKTAEDILNEVDISESKLMEMLEYMDSQGLISLNGDEENQTSYSEAAEEFNIVNPDAIDSPRVAGVMKIKIPGRPSARTKKDVKSCESYAAAKLYVQSRNCLSSLISETPDVPELYFNRGLMNYMIGRFDDAASDYTTALEAMPGSPDIFNNRGAAYYKNYNFDKAREDFEQALSLSPGHRDASYNSSLARVFSLFATNEDYTAAIQGLSGCLEEYPDTPSAYAVRGAAYESLYMLDEAVRDYEAALEHGFNPEDARYRLDKAAQHRDLIHNAENGVFAGDASPDDADYLKWYAISKFWNYYGSGAGADEGRSITNCLQQASALNPGDPEAYYYLGLIYTQERRFDDAAAALSAGAAAVEKIKNDDEYVYQSVAPLIYNSLGIHYYNTNKLDDAAANFNKAMEADNSGMPSGYYYNLAWVYLIQDKLDEAENDANLIEAWINNNTEPGPALEIAKQEFCTVKAYLLIKEKKYDEAQIYLERSRAIREDENNQGIFWAPDDEEFLWGLLAYSRGDADAAIRHLQDAIKHSPDEREQRFLLGRIYEETNRVSEAEQVYMELLQQMPGDKTLQAKLDRLKKAPQK